MDSTTLTSETGICIYVYSGKSNFKQKICAKVNQKKIKSFSKEYVTRARLKFWPSKKIWETFGRNFSEKGNSLSEKFLSFVPLFWYFSFSFSISQKNLFEYNVHFVLFCFFDSEMYIHVFRNYLGDVDKMFWANLADFGR